MGIILLVAARVLAQSPFDTSQIIEFPTIYIYPYYWMFPIEKTKDSAPFTASDPPEDVVDACAGAASSSSASVMAL